MNKQDELVAIFENQILVDPCTSGLVKYDDGSAYLERKRGSSKPSEGRKGKPLPPSQSAIQGWFSGEQDGMQKIVKTYVGRSILIGTALALFGDNKDQKALIKNSLVASASIEAFLLYWYNQKHG
tara:strand:+ start:1851 stop:2225 length:375 start_codon:yes stop_codon:yes gene_type:complete